MAVAVCMSPQAHAATSAAPAVTPRTAVADTTSQAGLSPAELLSVTHPVGKHAAGAAKSVTYTVKSGDSLSAIAGRVYHQQDAWPVLYWANRSQIRWANDIEVGEVLKVPAKPAKIPGVPSELGPAAPAPVQAPVAAAYASPTYAPAQATATVATHSYSGGTPGGSFGSCVVARESGGNSQVMNSSGHYGLYQFSASTWAAYGGSPGSFGNASVAEQNQVFANALAAGGQSNWSAYDGC